MLVSVAVVCVSSCDEFWNGHFVPLEVVRLLEKSGETLLGVDVEDSLCEQRGDTQHRQLLICFPLRRRWDGIQNDNFLHLGVGKAVVTGSTEKTVAGKGKDSAGTVLDQDIGGLAKGTSGIDHIVNEDAVTVLDVSDKVHCVNQSGASTLLDNHGQTNVLHVVLVHKTFLEFLGSVNTTGIRTDNDGVVQVLGSKVIESNDTAIQVVNGHSRAEETLDLTAMQINSDDTINSHSFDQTGDICGRNRNTSLKRKSWPCEETQYSHS